MENENKHNVMYSGIVSVNILYPDGIYIDQVLTMIILVGNQVYIFSFIVKVTNFNGELNKIIMKINYSKLMKFRFKQRANEKST